MEPTATKPFFVVRYFRWLFSWRIMRRLLLTFVTLVTLWALFHAEENWRGKNAWRKYKSDLTAKGEQLDLQTFIPKPIPDEQNRAAIPFFQAMFPKPAMNAPEWSTNYSAAAAMISSTNRSKSERHITDLMAWEKALAAVKAGEAQCRDRFQTDKLDAASRAQAAAAVLATLRECEDVFAQLRAASDRPHSSFMIHYNMDDPAGILLPHLAQIKGIVQRLQLKACAELAAEDNSSAFDDVKLSFRVTEMIKDEPFLISLLVRYASLQIAIHPVWEGLAENRWTDAQLTEIQTWLQQFDPVTELEKALDMERAFGIQCTELLARKKYRMGDLFDPAQRGTLGGDLENFIGSIVLPRGWFKFEQINLCRMYEAQLYGTFDTSAKRVFPERVKQNTRDFEREVGESKGIKAIFQHRVIAIMLLPALNSTSMRCSQAATAANQTIIACALERYRLKHGEFPTKLDGLAPQFIAKVPHDVLTGESYRYHRTDDGQFILYSIGWDGKDDGGTPGKTMWDEKSGDWVWRYPAKQ